MCIRDREASDYSKIYIMGKSLGKEQVIQLQHILYMLYLIYVTDISLFCQLLYGFIFPPRNGFLSKGDINPPSAKT